MVRRVDVLPGRSSFRWSELTRKFSRYWLLPSAGLTIVAVIGRQIGTTTFDIVLDVALISDLIGGVLGIALLLIVVPTKERREVRAGYTSLNGRHLEVTQVAPDTKVVIREAGQPALNFETFRRSVARVRVKAEEQP